jgi:hypothetical protein
MPKPDTQPTRRGLLTAGGTAALATAFGADATAVTTPPGPNASSHPPVQPRRA